jgi:hypothetical protein
VKRALDGYQSKEVMTLRDLLELAATPPLSGWFNMALSPAFA